MYYDQETRTKTVASVRATHEINKKTCIFFNQLAENYQIQ